MVSLRVDGAAERLAAIMIGIKKVSTLPDRR